MSTNDAYSNEHPPIWRPTLLPAHSLEPLPDRVDGEVALQALIMAQGKPAVAAERLGLKDADTLLAALVMNEALHERMRTVMRAFTLIRLLGVAESLEDTLMERVDELDAKEVAKLFASVLTLADLMTRGTPSQAPNTGNIHETLLKVLPPEVRNALRVVQASSMGDAILATEAAAADNNAVA